MGRVAWVAADSSFSRHSDVPKGGLSRITITEREARR